MATTNLANAGGETLCPPKPSAESNRPKCENASAPCSIPSIQQSDSFALYLHTPYCAHRCLFCPFYINYGKEGFSAGYTDLLSRDIDITASRLAPSLDGRQVTTVYFGGGTPSDLDRDDLSRILRQLPIQFPFANDVEVTVEGRIRGFTADKAREWVQAGANRFSIGLQTSDTELRRRMGRLADRTEIKEILSGLVDSGAVVVVDLIYGFPGQTVAMLEEDVRFLAEDTRIHGLDLYELRDFPGSPLARAIESGRLPPVADASLRVELLAAGNAALTNAGFDQFHPRHWRRDPRERSIYNQFARGPAPTAKPAAPAAPHTAAPHAMPPHSANGASPHGTMPPHGAKPPHPMPPHGTMSSGTPPHPMPAHAMPPHGIEILQKPRDIIPFGSGAGGRINGVPISLPRDIAEYTAQILRGEKKLS